MKNLFTILLVFAFGFTQAQDKMQPKYEKQGELVKATYYYEDGKVHQEGFFKNKKLTGMWTKYDREGNKISIGFYKEGKKVGKWFQWHKNKLREITYKDNTIANVSIWREDTRIASNK